MDKIIPPSERFKKNVLLLISLLKDIVKDCWDKGYRKLNPIMVDIVMNFAENYDDDTLIGEYIIRTHEKWETVKHRKEDNLIHHINEIVRSIAKDKFDKYLIIIEELTSMTDSGGKKIVTQEDREAIWKVIDSLVKISINHIHKKRGPKVKIVTDGPNKPIYTVNYLQEIPLMKYVKTWSVELIF